MMGSDRDSKGRFLKGHGVRGQSKGRPTRAVEAQRLREFNRAVGPRWVELVEKSIEMALAGDMRAMKLLFSYAMGNPVQLIRTEVVPTVEIDREFQEALERGYGGGAE